MDATPRTYPEAGPWTEADVRGVWLSFASGATSNSLELTYEPGARAASLELSLQEGSYRRTAHRYPRPAFARNLIGFVTQVSEGWAARSILPSAAQAEFTWNVSLTGEDGACLRDCSGAGLIPDATAFFALARGLDHVSRGFALGVGPLRAIERALRHPSIESYDPALDEAAGGLIALAIAKEYFADAAASPSAYHREQCFALARTYYKKASEAGSSQALAHLGWLDLGLDGARDLPRARQRFELAQKMGSSEACALLADLLVENHGTPYDELRASELYEKGYALAAASADAGALGFAAERYACALASGVGGKPDVVQARDLAVEAELALANALMEGQTWLKPSLERAQALSERLAHLTVETSEP